MKVPPRSSARSRAFRYNRFLSSTRPRASHSRSLAEVNPGQETVRWLKFELDVRLNSISVNTKPYPGGTRVGQLTESGIGLMIPANLKKHDRAVLEFTLPNSEKPLQVNAVLRDRSGFRYWFEFVSLTDEQRAKIQKACSGPQPRKRE